MKVEDEIQQVLLSHLDELVSVSTHVGEEPCHVLGYILLDDFLVVEVVHELSQTRDLEDWDHKLLVLHEVGEESDPVGLELATIMLQEATHEVDKQVHFVACVVLNAVVDQLSQDSF